MLSLKFTRDKLMFIGRQALGAGGNLVFITLLSMVTLDPLNKKRDRK
jgi:hypothetical protein